MSSSLNPIDPPWTSELQQQARAQMLALIELPPQADLEILSSSHHKGSEQVQNFINHFEKQIWPALQQKERLSIEISGFHTALDRALYQNEQEQTAWIEQKTRAEMKYHELSVSPEEKAKITRWADLARQLPSSLQKQELPQWALRLQEDMDLNEFTLKEKPLLDELTHLSTEIDQASNTSPIVGGLAQAEQKSNALTAQFFSGALSFSQALEELEKLTPSGRTALGQDVSTKMSHQLQRCAEIRTQLAESKGHPTWAQYVCATQARQYRKGLKTAQEKIAFLKDLLQSTKNSYEKYLSVRCQELKVDPSKLKRSALGLLRLEEDSLIREYFPREKIESVWAATMRESGFSSVVLENIHLDGFPREKKYTHAYMNNITSHQPKTFKVNVDTLSFDRQQIKSWLPAQIYIVQNYRDDGPEAWTTAWHEGGHAMDFAHQQDLTGYGAAYGFVETHSMTMERFFEDEEFLLRHGKTRQGKPLSSELFHQYVRNAKINALVQLRTQASYALYDLLLWNKPYSSSYSDSHSFVDDARTLFGELMEEATLLSEYTIESIDSRNSSFATSHFYGGGVRYFGYIVADMAADMTAQHLWDFFEKKTGRRSLNQQNQIAQLLTDHYYRDGFLKEFPQAIEDFTGKPFIPKNAIMSMEKSVQEYTRLSV